MLRLAGSCWTCRGIQLRGLPRLPLHPAALLQQVSLLHRRIRCVLTAVPATGPRSPAAAGNAPAGCTRCISTSVAYQVKPMRPYRHEPLRALMYESSLARLRRRPAPCCCCCVHESLQCMWRCNVATRRKPLHRSTQYVWRQLLRLERHAQHTYEGSCGPWAACIT